MASMNILIGTKGRHMHVYTHEAFPIRFLQDHTDPEVQLALSPEEARMLIRAIQVHGSQILEDLEESHHLTYPEK